MFLLHKGIVYSLGINVMFYTKLCSFADRTSLNKDSYLKGDLSLKHSCRRNSQRFLILFSISHDKTQNDIFYGSWIL